MTPPCILVEVEFQRLAAHEVRNFTMVRCRCEYYVEQDDTIPIVTVEIGADTYDRALGKALRLMKRPGRSHMLIWRVLDDPLLEAAHRRSLGNRGRWLMAVSVVVSTA